MRRLERACWAGAGRGRHDDGRSAGQAGRSHGSGRSRRVHGLACGPATPTPGSSAAPNTIPPAGVAFLRYACGRFPFGAEVLDITREDELANTPEAAALRAHLAQPGPDFDSLPDRGWTLVGTDATGAEFVAVTDGDPGMVNVLVARGGAGLEGHRLGPVPADPRPPRRPGQRRLVAPRGPAEARPEHAHVRGAGHGA